MRSLKNDIAEPYSAGVVAKGLDPRAVKVMAEAGVDISRHRSKSVQELANRDFDYVVTVCDKAKESCPVSMALGGVEIMLTAKLL